MEPHHSQNQKHPDHQFEKLLEWGFPKTVEMIGQQVQNLVVEMMLVVVDEEVLGRIDDVPSWNDEHLVVDMPAVKP
ncbi:hypothetical protein Tco_1428297 [Tanacetum coccineum]